MIRILLNLFTLVLIIIHGERTGSSVKYIKTFAECLKEPIECIKREEQRWHSKCLAPKATLRCVSEKGKNLNPNWSIANLFCHCWNITEAAIENNFLAFLKNPEKWEIKYLYGEPYTEEELIEDQNFKTLKRYSNCLTGAIECLENDNSEFSKLMTKASECLEASQDAVGIHSELMIFANCFESSFSLSCMRVHN